MTLVRLTLGVVLGLWALLLAAGCATKLPMYLCIPAQTEQGPAILCAPMERHAK